MPSILEALVNQPDVEAEKRAYIQWCLGLDEFSWEPIDFLVDSMPVTYQ